MPDTFLLILVGVLLVTTTALGYGFFMLMRWKVAFDGKEIVAFPSNALDDLNRSLGKFEKAVLQSNEETRAAASNSTENHARIFERVQALLKAVSETRAEYRTLRDEIESKNSELERFKSGYDLRILRTSIGPVLANHALVVQELGREELQADLRRFAELLKENYEDLFGSMNIQVVYPEVGGDVREAKGVAFPPNTVEAPSPDQLGCITSVESPCYVMKYEDNDVVVREAQVTIFAESTADGDD